MAITREVLLCCGWPGLRPLWLRGSYAALALAVGFGVLLNLLLAAGFVWTEWVGPEARFAGLIALLATWSLAAGAACYSARCDRRRAARQRAASESGEPDELAEAIGEYLQGKWYETEKILRRLLRRDRRDAEALLLMATLCRHAGRWEEAERRLGELTSLESAEKWHTEIDHERRLLAQRRTGNDRAPEPSASPRREAAAQAPDMNKAA